MTNCWAVAKKTWMKRYFPFLRDFSQSNNYIRNLSLNWQFWFYGPSSPKKSISSQKQENVISGLKQRKSIPKWMKFRYQTLAQTNNFHALDQISPKRSISSLKRKYEHHQWILHILRSTSIKFHLQLTILIFGPIFPKKYISGRKGRKWTVSLNYPYSN